MKLQDGFLVLVCLLTLSMGVLRGDAYITSGDIEKGKGVIAGKVTEKMTYKPLVGVVVELIGKSHTTITDEKGEYRFTGLKPGSYKVRYLIKKHSAHVKSDIVVKSRRITFVDAEIDLAPVVNEEVGVVAESYFHESRNEPPSMVNFSAEEIRRSPGSAGDISRIVASLPSVAQVTDNSNGLAVRGGSPRENAFYIDNIEVPNINHFPEWGSTGGPISLINTDFISDVNFYPGGYSAIYGDKMSSVMNISFREGNREEFDGQVGISMMGATLSLEAPVFKGKGSFLLSATKSYLDLIMRGNEAVPKYTDIQGKFVLDLNESNKITILGIAGFDEYKSDKESAIKDSDDDYGGFESKENTFGINWFTLWGDGGYSNTSLSRSYVKYDTNWFEAIDDSLRANINSSMESFVLRNVNHYSFSKTFQMDFGFELKRLIHKNKNVVGDYTDVTGKYIPETRDFENITSNKAAIFTSFTWNPTRRFTLNLGVRGDYFQINKNYTVSPRFGFNYDFTSRFSMHGSYGVFYQNLPLDFVSLKEEIKKFRTPRADHFVLGFDYLFGGAVKLTVDGYLKKYKGLPLSPQHPTVSLIDSGETSEFDDYVDNGIAETYGIEVTLQKKLKENFYGLVSVSLFRSRYKDYHGKWRDRLYDNKFIFSLVGGYKPNDKWEFSAKWTYAGGIPMIPYDMALSKKYNTEIFDMDRVNEERRPAYHSLNLRVDRRYNFSSTNLTIFISVWNAYNRRNLSRYYWNSYKKALGRQDQWKMMPILGIEYEF